MNAIKSDTNRIDAILVFMLAVLREAIYAILIPSAQPFSVVPTPVFPQRARTVGAKMASAVRTIVVAFILSRELRAAGCGLRIVGR